MSESKGNTQTSYINADSYSEIGLSLVTGGAGFIGSHIVDSLIYNNVDVKVLDNLSSGNILNLSNWNSNQKFHFINDDLKNSQSVKEALKDVKTVFHMAAYPQVRSGLSNPAIFLEENIKNTFCLLEEIRRSNVETILFASSSTIYGEPEIIPTPEGYGPLFPISAYGASKLACEAILSSCCSTYGISGLIFRFANIIGSRSRRGVIWDFIEKLRLNSKKLEILGDGTQTKSYLHISDCLECLFLCLSKSIKKIDVFNLGSHDGIDVLSIARIVSNTMNLKGVEFVTRDTLNDGRGWIGDVKNMELDIGKLNKIGWTPRLSSLEAVTLTSKELLQESGNRQR